HERRLERQPLAAAGNHHARALRGGIPALAARGAARFALGVGLPVAVARGSGGHEARLPRTREALGAPSPCALPLARGKKESPRRSSRSASTGSATRAARRVPLG